MTHRPNVLALAWIDLFAGLEDDYRRLWGHYTDLQRAYLYLLLQLREERELRDLARELIDQSFPLEPKEPRWPGVRS